MLHHLRVVNLGVIEDASIELTEGFNVITGETGTGKTLLLGGLRLLLGEKADSGLVGSSGDEARAEGIFSHGDEETAIVRSLPAGGRSRAYADGVLVSATALEKRVGSLVEIVGQHDQLSLRRPAEVLELVDSSAPDHIGPVARRYRERWDELREAQRETEALGGDGMTLRRELDLVAFQAEEIAKEQLRAGEDEELEAQARRLRNLEEIALNLAESARMVEAMSEGGGEVVARLRKVGDLDPAAREMGAQAELLAEATADLGRAITAAIEGLERDQGQLDEVERRLTVIGDLKRKYGRTVDDIVEFGRQAQERSDEIARMLGMADEVEQRLDQAKSSVAIAAEDLTSARAAAAERLTAAAASHLTDLGIASPRLEVRLETLEPGPSGADRAELWFSSDARLDMAPAGVGASGGELSRLVLALRLASRSSTDSSLVFDEVDTGIGGATALAMGRKLADLSRSTQVICVTHLPQVAAFAQTHFVVDRDEGTADVRQVDGDARIREITRMLAGLPESEGSRQAAEELLGIAAKAAPGAMS